MVLITSLVFVSITLTVLSFSLVTNARCEGSAQAAVLAKTNVVNKILFNFIMLPSSLKLFTAD